MRSVCQNFCSTVRIAACTRSCRVMPRNMMSTTIMISQRAIVIGRGVCRHQTVRDVDTFTTGRFTCSGVVRAGVVVFTFVSVADVDVDADDVLASCAAGS
jgi:hypothetical protein